MTSSEAIAPHVSFLRRYARALTGDRARGDSYVRACLETLVADPAIVPAEMRPRVGLYWLFHAIWEAASADSRYGEETELEPERTVQKRLKRLIPEQRHALLLTALEGFTMDDAAKILNKPRMEVAALATTAMDEIAKDISTDVMIIEDQSMIALDLSNILEDLGHRVIHIASTRADAVAAAEEQRPHLILADVQLADNTSGIDAVRDILKESKVPVVFVTAYPERLLRSAHPEPTFLITKPFMPEAIKLAVSQALFFNPPERFNSPVMPTAH
jgi:CheY-like chemotaxis protein/DNA-directed RNA polymerase specialized sigma24 family protein